MLTSFLPRGVPLFLPPKPFRRVRGCAAPEEHEDASSFRRIIRFPASFLSAFFFPKPDDDDDKDDETKRALLIAIIFIRAGRPLPRGEKRLLGLCGVCVSVCARAALARVCLKWRLVSNKRRDVRVVRSYVVGIGTRKIIINVIMVFSSIRRSIFSR